MSLKISVVALLSALAVSSAFAQTAAQLRAKEQAAHNARMAQQQAQYAAERQRVNQQNSRIAVQQRVLANQKIVQQQHQSYNVPYKPITSFPASKPYQNQNSCYQQGRKLVCTKR